MSININCSNNKLHITLHSYSMSPSGKKKKKKNRYIQINLSRSCGHASLMKNVNRLGFQGDLNTYQFPRILPYIQLTDDLVKPVNSQELQVIMSNNK